VYSQLGSEERYYIEVAIKSGSSLNKIAQSLNRSQSSISRELKRNSGQRGYRHKQAHRFAQERHRHKPKSVKMVGEVKALVSQYIREDWSPEQVVGRLNADGIINLHHETVYQHILEDKRNGGDLHTHLRHRNKTYRKRYGSAHNRTGIPNRVDIDQRPEEANNRERIGDWEADTIIGKNHQGAIVTLDERKSKVRLAAPLKRKKAQELNDAMVKLLKPVKQFVKTITYDNGKEFTLHEAVAESISCDTFFAKPYHSWERGQNENANGLLRQYFPKAMELTNLTFPDVWRAVDKLNNRPRKCLGYKTPYEAFKEFTGVDLKNLLGYALMT